MDCDSYFMQQSWMVKSRQEILQCAAYDQTLLSFLEPLILSYSSNILQPENNQNIFVILGMFCYDLINNQNSSSQINKTVTPKDLQELAQNYFKIQTIEGLPTTPQFQEFGKNLNASFDYLKCLQNREVAYFQMVCGKVVEPSEFTPYSYRLIIYENVQYQLLMILTKNSEPILKQIQGSQEIQFQNNIKQGQTSQPIHNQYRQTNFVQQQPQQIQQQVARFITPQVFPNQSQQITSYQQQQPNQSQTPQKNEKIKILGIYKTSQAQQININESHQQQQTDYIFPNNLQQNANQQISQSNPKFQGQLLKQDNGQQVNISINQQFCRQKITQAPQQEQKQQFTCPQANPQNFQPRQSQQEIIFQQIQTPILQQQQHMSQNFNQSAQFQWPQRNTQESINEQCQLKFQQQQFIQNPQLQLPQKHYQTFNPLTDNCLQFQLNDNKQPKSQSQPFKMQTNDINCQQYQQSQNFCKSNQRGFGYTENPNNQIEQPNTIQHQYYNIQEPQIKTACFPQQHQQNSEVDYLFSTEALNNSSTSTQKEANIVSTNLEIPNLQQKSNIECDICFCYYNPINESIMLPCCQKQIHSECLRNDLFTKAIELKGLDYITCLFCNISYRSHQEFLKGNIPMVEMVKIFTIEARKNATSSCFKCGFLIQISEDRRNIQFEYQCANCQIKMCSLCKQEFHGKNQQVKSIKSQIQNQQCPSERKAILEALKQTQTPIVICPFCFTIQSKDDRCNHVTCSQCQSSLCSACSVDRRPIVAHGNHYHRKGCVDYRPWFDEKKKVEIKEKEFDQKKCKKCKETNLHCQYPISLEEYKKQQDF